MRQIVRLAWPAVGAMFLNTALTITDAIWVGRLGAPQMAAVISSMFVIWIIFSLAGIIGTGTVAVLSRFYGAREFDRVAHAGRQATILSLAFSIVLTAIGLASSGFLFKVMNTDAEVTAYGEPYLQVAFAITFLICMAELLGAVFRASGDTKTPLIVTAISIALNLVLDPLLIFGIGPFPRLEVFGAALATAASYLLGFAIYMIFIKTGKLTFAFSWTKSVRPDFRMLGQLIKIGTPLSIGGVIFSAVYLFMNRIAASFGTDAIAALGIGNRIESFSYLICFGFSTAVATLVGQNLGALKPERAEKSVWYTVAITGALTAVIALFFVLIPRQLASVFIGDPNVQSIAVDYLMIVAVSEPAMAVVIVLEGAFSGAGNTMPPMIASMAYSTARLPIAYLLCFEFGVGVNGIWWAITVTMVAAAIILTIWFQRGKWKLQEIH